MIRLAVTLVAAIAASVSAQGNPAMEEPIEAPGPKGPLAGILLKAGSESWPVALIIPGSGPTDRDGNNPLGVRAASYQLLAKGLAANSIATVRIDKRGMFGSVAAVPDANAVTLADYVADTAAWVSVIRERTCVPCVWLIGHSEGGLVALASAREVEGLCGLVLIATAGRRLGDVLKAQLRANPANAPLLEAAENAIDRLAVGERVDATTLPPPLVPLFNPAVQGFLISTIALDPAELARNAQLPILIVQGGKDLQVTLEDAKLLAAAAPSAKLTILPEANHVLKDIKGKSRAENIAAYAAPDLPIANNLIPTITEFIRLR